MESQFFAKINTLIVEKKSNNTIFTKVAYAELIENVLESRGKLKNKTPEDYQRLKRYDVKIIGKNQYLIHPISEKIYVFLEEIF